MIKSYQKVHNSGILKLMSNSHKEMCKQCKLSYYSMFHWGMCTFQILLSSMHLCKLYKPSQKYKQSKVQGIMCMFHCCYSTQYCKHMLGLIYWHQNTQYNLLQFQNKSNKGTNIEGNSIQKRYIPNYKYIGLYSCQHLYKFSSWQLMCKLHKLSGSYNTHYY